MPPLDQQAKLEWAIVKWYHMYLTRGLEAKNADTLRRTCTGQTVAVDVGTTPGFGAIRKDAKQPSTFGQVRARASAKRPR